MTHWDSWHSQALTRNVSADLAQLGRELLRDHAQHGLDGDFHLGSADDMPLMLELATQVPATAFFRFMGDIVTHSGSSRNGDQTAHELLSEKLGSVQAADEALAQEESRAKEVWQQFGARR